MSVEENKTLVLEFLDQVWNKGNLAVIDDTLSADYVNHDLSQGTFPPGPGAYSEVATRYLAAFPDLHTTIEQVIAEGDKVVIHGTDRGTHQAEFMGILPTGRSITVTFTTIYRIADGRIAEEWANADSLGMLQQLGGMPEPEGKSSGL